VKTYNKKLYEALNEIADLLAITGAGFFQVRAYHEAGRVLMEEAEPITEENASIEAFKALPRIGDAIAKKMMDYIETGKIKALEELRKEVPKGVRDLLKIPGLGPGRIGKLYFMAGIRNKKELIDYAKSGEMINLPGFGEKSVDKILEAIASDQQKKKRHKRTEVEPIAKKIIKIIKGYKSVKSAEPAGSFRRGVKTVGDLDILITGDLDIKKALKAIEKVYEKITILGSGETKTSFMIFPQNLQVDIRLLPEESYGAALLYFTGSKDFNVKMRRKAIEMGYLLNEYGLFKEGEYMAGETEEEIFDILRMKFTLPKNRK
jgi:DNA polymerase (family 10)